MFGLMADLKTIDQYSKTTIQYFCFDYRELDIDNNTLLNQATAQSRITTTSTTYS